MQVPLSTEKTEINPYVTVGGLSLKEELKAALIAFTQDNIVANPNDYCWEGSSLKFSDSKKFSWKAMLQFIVDTVADIIQSGADPKKHTVVVSTKSKYLLPEYLIGRLIIERGFHHITFLMTDTHYKYPSAKAAFYKEEELIDAELRAARNDFKDRTQRFHGETTRGAGGLTIQFLSSINNVKKYLPEGGAQVVKLDLFSKPKRFIENPQVSIEEANTIAFMLDMECPVNPDRINWGCTIAADGTYSFVLDGFEEMTSWISSDLVMGIKERLDLEITGYLDTEIFRLKKGNSENLLTQAKISHLIKGVHSFFSQEFAAPFYYFYLKDEIVANANKLVEILTEASGRDGFGKSYAVDDGRAMMTQIGKDIQTTSFSSNLVLSLPAKVRGLLSMIFNNELKVETTKEPDTLIMMLKETRYISCALPKEAPQEVRLQFIADLVLDVLLAVPTGEPVVIVDNGANAALVSFLCGKLLRAFGFPVQYELIDPIYRLTDMELFPDEFTKAVRKNKGIGDFAELPVHCLTTGIDLKHNIPAGSRIVVIETIPPDNGHFRQVQNSEVEFNKPLERILGYNSIVSLEEATALAFFPSVYPQRFEDRLALTLGGKDSKKFFYDTGCKIFWNGTYDLSFDGLNECLGRGPEILATLENELKEFLDGKILEMRGDHSERRLRQKEITLLLRQVHAIVEKHLPGSSYYYLNDYYTDRAEVLKTVRELGSDYKTLFTMTGDRHGRLVTTKTRL